jgi:hypothetical protein
MKRFVRRQGADDRQLKLIARADERKAELQSASTITANETLTMDASGEADDVTGEGAPIAPPRPSLDQLWGLT